MTLGLTTLSIECLYAECRYVECRDLFIAMMKSTCAECRLLNVVTLSVIMPNVMAPSIEPLPYSLWLIKIHSFFFKRFLVKVLVSSQFLTIQINRN